VVSRCFWSSNEEDLKGTFAIHLKVQNRDASSEGRTCERERKRIFYLVRENEVLSQMRIEVRNEKQTKKREKKVENRNWKSYKKFSH
jgi:hypothetical protein